MTRELSYDDMFQVIFSNNHKIMLQMINDCCGYNFKYDENKIKVVKNEIPRDNINEMKLVCDYAVIIEDTYLFNVELNRKNYEGWWDRNFCYILKLHTSRIKKKTPYCELEKYKCIQINLNRFPNPDDEIINVEEIYRKGKKLNVSTDTLKMYHYDIVKSHNFVYNNDIRKAPKDIRWAALFMATSIKDMDYIIGDDMLDMEDKMELLSASGYAEDEEIEIPDKVILFENENAMRLKAYEDLAREEGIIDTIKSMLENKLDYEIIAKITKKSIEEIKEIEKTMKK